MNCGLGLSLIPWRRARLGALPPQETPSSFLFPVSQAVPASPVHFHPPSALEPRSYLDAIRLDGRDRQDARISTLGLRMA